MKRIIAALLAVSVLVCGSALAGKNPGSIYETVAAASNTAVLISGNAGKRVSFKGQIYITPATYNVRASFWRYTSAGAVEQVYGGETYAWSDSVITIPAGMIYPVEVDCDYISLRAVTTATDVSVLWFRN